MQQRWISVRLTALRLLFILAAFGGWSTVHLAAQSAPLKNPSSTTSIVPSPQGPIPAVVQSSPHQPGSPIRPYRVKVRASIIKPSTPSASDTPQALADALPPVTAPLSSAELPPASIRSTKPDSTGASRLFVEAVDRKAVWGSQQVKYAAPGQPIQVKLVGANIAALVQLVPSENPRGGLDIIASGQVWIMQADKGIQYRTTINSLSVSLSERIFFFPLGYAADGAAPLIVEIIVEK